MVRVGWKEAEAFAERVLVASGISASDASVVASCLVRADLRGVSTHGLVRIPSYLDRLDHQLIMHPGIKPVRTTSVTAMVDTNNGFGFVAATIAMNEAVAMASESGIGLVAVKGEFALWDGLLLRVTSSRCRHDCDGLFERLACNAAVGRTRGTTRYESNCIRSTHSCRATGRSRHVAGSCCTRQDSSCHDPR